MNRIDRLFNILLLLQRKPRIRAQDLADSFGISKRTVYRDISALLEMGVPVVSMPGEGYELMEGFYVPPLIFTPQEASALFLGAKLLSHQAKGQLPENAEKAITKLSNALPTTTLKSVERLVEIIDFYLPEKRFDLEDPRLVTVQQAIHEKRLLKLVYHSYSEDKITIREIESYALHYGEGAWYLLAYCRLRRGRRSFRLERINKLTLMDTHFQPRQLSTDSSPLYEVKVRFDTKIVRWMRERQHYAFVNEETLPNTDDIFVHYKVHSFMEIKGWLMGWGTSAEVLEPQALRTEIREEARKLSEMLT